MTDTDGFTPEYGEEWRRIYRASADTAPRHRVVPSLEFEDGESACRGLEIVPRHVHENYWYDVNTPWEGPLCGACITYTMRERDIRDGITTVPEQRDAQDGEGRG